MRSNLVQILINSLQGKKIITQQPVVGLALIGNGSSVDEGINTLSSRYCNSSFGNNDPIPFVTHDVLSTLNFWVPMRIKPRTSNKQSENIRLTNQCFTISRKSYNGHNYNFSLTFEFPCDYLFFLCSRSENKLNSPLKEDEGVEILEGNLKRKPSSLLQLNELGSIKKKANTKPESASKILKIQF